MSLAYGERHAVMRDREIEIAVRNRILARLDEQEENNPYKSGEWNVDDEPIII